MDDGFIKKLPKMASYDGYQSGHREFDGSMIKYWPINLFTNKMFIYVLS